MQITMIPSQGRAVALLTVLTASLTAWARLAPAGQLVDYTQHGGNWNQDQCGSRFRQSPIDLSAIYKTPTGTFLYLYPEVNSKNLSVTNDGRVISADIKSLGVPAGSVYVPMSGRMVRFNLTSIVLRAKSEHTIRGKHAPVEVQLVHTPADEEIDTQKGPSSVTLSLLVTCPNPPEAKPVYPGAALLQENATEKSRAKHSSMFLQRQSPLQDGTAGASDENVGVEANAEVDFVHSMLQGEQAVDRRMNTAEVSMDQAPAPAPAPDGADVEAYSPPAVTDIGYNPMLQFLVFEEPPSLDTTDTVDLSKVALNLNQLVGGGTYFWYWGSETLPPCSERTMWLVRREEVEASTAQVLAIHKAIHLMSDGAGNYRTIMPIGDREVDVLAAKEGELERPTSEPPYVEPESTRIAKDAITIAKAAADYAKNQLDLPLQRASNAHWERLKQDPLRDAKRNHSLSSFPPPPEDMPWSVGVIAHMIGTTISKEFFKELPHYLPVTVNLAKSILRQKILKEAGYMIPTTTTPGPLGSEEIILKNGDKLTGMYDMDKNVTIYLNGSTMPGPPPGYNMTAAMALRAGLGMAPSAAPPGSGINSAINSINQPPPFEVAARDVPIEAVKLPPGAQPVPPDWPDENAWPNGAPPANWPAGADPAVWPNPNGARPASWDQYTWERYQYNWRHYRRDYQPYQSHYQAARYNFHRRRTITSRTSFRRPYTSSTFSSGRRRSASRSSRSAFSPSSSTGGRRRSARASSSGGRRRSATYSSAGGRRRSATMSSNSRSTSTRRSSPFSPTTRSSSKSGRRRSAFMLR